MPGVGRSRSDPCAPLFPEDNQAMGCTGVEIPMGSAPRSRQCPRLTTFRLDLHFRLLHVPAAALGSRSSFSESQGQAQVEGGQVGLGADRFERDFLPRSALRLPLEQVVGEPPSKVVPTQLQPDGVPA